MVLRGRVDSVAPASSLSYAPIAPQNATGNFTKIVQRLPTRIRLDPAQPETARLRVGMSVEPEIETGAGALTRAGVPLNPAWRPSPPPVA